MSGARGLAARLRPTLDGAATSGGIRAAADAGRRPVKYTLLMDRADVQVCPVPALEHAAFVAAGVRLLGRKAATDLSAPALRHEPQAHSGSSLH